MTPKKNVFDLKTMMIKAILLSVVKMSAVLTNVVAPKPLPLHSSLPDRGNTQALRTVYTSVFTAFLPAKTQATVNPSDTVGALSPLGSAAKNSADPRSQGKQCYGHCRLRFCRPSQTAAVLRRTSKPV
jgi:hypothetical protein